MLVREVMSLISGQKKSSKSFNTQISVQAKKERLRYFFKKTAGNSILYKNKLISKNFTLEVIIAQDSKNCLNKEKERIFLANKKSSNSLTHINSNYMILSISMVFLKYLPYKSVKSALSNFKYQLTILVSGQILVTVNLIFLK